MTASDRPTNAQLAELIHAQMGLQDKTCTPKFIETLLECIELFDKKQLDYGPGNIAEFGELGVVVRTNDKMARMKNLLFQGGQWNPQNAANEPIEDTWKDVCNYGAIGLMCLRGDWPGVEGRQE
jgi:hypothetical protein